MGWTEASRCHRLTPHFPRRDTGGPKGHGVETALHGDSSSLLGCGPGFRQKSPPNKQLYSLRDPLWGQPLGKAGNQWSGRVLESSSSVHRCSHRGHRCMTWSYVLIPGTHPGRFSVDNTEGEGATGERVAWGGRWWACP